MALWSPKSPSGVCCSLLEASEYERNGGVGEGPEQGHAYDQEVRGHQYENCLEVSGLYSLERLMREDLIQAFKIKGIDNIEGEYSTVHYSSTAVGKRGNELKFLDPRVWLKLT